MLTALGRAWDWLLDQLIAAPLGIPDWLALMPETSVEQATLDERRRSTKSRGHRPKALRAYSAQGVGNQR
jgi:hypothetical protein